MTYTQVWDAMQNKVSDRMIQRDEDGAFVPFDDGNVDYQATFPSGTITAAGNIIARRTR